MPPPGEDVGDCDRFDGNVGGICDIGNDKELAGL